MTALVISVDSLAIVPRVSVPIRDWTRALTKLAELPSLKSIIAELPAEVGEIAPLKTKSVVEETLPSWRSALDGPLDGQLPALQLPGSSSYQRTTERPPVPLIVCWVQTASAPLAPGSGFSTAWVSRVSELS